MVAFNSVVVAVLLVLVLCVCRVNVVISLTTAAIIGGLVDGFSLSESVKIFSSGLGAGARIALSYAILGAFASAVAHSGMPELLVGKIVGVLNKRPKSENGTSPVKWLLFFVVGFMAIACKNVIPVHIAFIPILIPPLLGVFNFIKVDRRAVACIITCGVIVAYMLVPIGFGEIFLDNILLYYLKSNGLQITLGETISALKLPAIGMLCGVVLAIIRYGHPREYGESKAREHETIRGGEAHSMYHIVASAIAVAAAFVTQIFTGEIILGALAGFFVFSCCGIVCRHESDRVIVDGFKMMAAISFTMLAAAGFGSVIRASTDMTSLIEWLANHAGDSKILAICCMLGIGFLISVGIGSSFSTVPIVAPVYVPLCISLGISPAATAIIVAISGVCGDAGSPASDSTLGPTMGLNADGQHNHIADTVIPAFLHIAMPAFICGTIAAALL
jgi:predicted histidine transporter YuiF (NhaC family)